MEHVRGLVTVAAIVVAAALDSGGAAAQQCYGWRVSLSATFPEMNWGNLPVGEIGILHLWYAFNTPDGMSASDMTVEVTPNEAVEVLAFNPVNGYLNAGSATHILLAVGGCPNGPVNAGNWLIIPQISAWEFCLGGKNVTVTCDFVPIPYPNAVFGYVNGGAPLTCHAGDDPCPTISTARTTWGSIKSLYR